MLDRTTRQKTDKKGDLSHIMNQLDLKDIYGTLNRRSHVLFKYVSNILHKDDVSPQNSIHLRGLKLCEVHSFSDHNTMNSEISNRRKFGKFKCGS